MSDVEILKLEEDTLNKLREANLILEDMSRADMENFLSSDFGSKIDEVQQKVLLLITSLKDGKITLEEFRDAVENAFTKKDEDLEYEVVKKTADEIVSISKALSETFASFSDVFGIDSDVSSALQNIIDKFGTVTGQIIKALEEGASFDKIIKETTESADKLSDNLEEVVDNTKKASANLGENAGRNAFCCINYIRYTTVVYSNRNICGKINKQAT
jgi:hypothetical protein